MSLYSIGFKSNKEYFVDLNDEEVEILVKLITQSESSNVKEISLELLYPKLYRKLYKAFFIKNCNAQHIFNILEGYRSGALKYDIHEMMYYCEDFLDYYYDFDPEEYFGETDLADFYNNPESYADEIDDMACYDFTRWFKDYLDHLSKDEALDFYCGLVYEGIETKQSNFTVKIPDDIIKKANG